MKSLINHQKEVITIFSPAFIKINFFEGQKYLNSINIFTELPKALLTILFILNLLSLFYIECFGIHCMLDSFYFKNCFNIVRLLKMFALMIPVFLINISLLDYFSNNS
jgi:flagellar biosynthesis protein FlhB